MINSFRKRPLISILALLVCLAFVQSVGVTFAKYVLNKDIGSITLSYNSYSSGNDSSSGSDI